MLSLERIIGIALLVAGLQVSVHAESIPDGYKLVYKQDFDSADALKDFEFSDANAWKFSEKGNSEKGGALELFQQSKYKTKVRSPFNIALVRSKVFTDFVLEADLVQTGKEYGHRDMCIYYGFTEPAKFYYTHIATKADPNAHNCFIVNDAPRKNFAKEVTTGADWGLDKWHRMRLVRSGKDGTIKVFFDDMAKPIMLAQDKTFADGQVGFGSFDDTGKIDNIRIYAPADSVKERTRNMFPAPADAK